MNLVLVHTPVGAYHHLRGGPIVFSAPHEEIQIRDGVEKPSERGTAALACRAASICDGTALATHGPQVGDPAWDRHHPFTVHALDLARDGVLIDLHRMRPRGFDLCLGLGPDHHLSKVVWLPTLERLLDADLTVCLNWPFSARDRPIVGQAGRAGIPAVQVEISMDLFDHPERIEVIAHALALAACEAIAGR